MYSWKRRLCELASAVALRVDGHHILVYHSIVREPWNDPYEMTVSLSRFEEQVAVLSGAKVVALDAALPGGVSVTFDDGFSDNVALALPVLQRHEIPATLFVVVEAVQEGRFTHLPAPPAGRQWSAPATWNDLTEWVRMGLRVGLHGWEHTPFTTQMRHVLRSQLQRGVKTLEDRLGCPVEDLAYPYGDYRHCSPAIADLVGELGFKRAYTGVAGPNRSGTPRTLLRRVRVTEWDDARYMRRKIEGRFDFYGTYQWIRHLIVPRWTLNRQAGNQAASPESKDLHLG